MVNMAQQTRTLPPALKLTLDFAPLAVFFIGFHIGGVMAATAALIVATLISLTVIYWVERKLALAPLISGMLVTVMGGLGIALQDEQFIKMKPTLINGVFAAVLLIGALKFKRGLLSYVLDVAVQLTPEGWRVLSIRWGLFFLFLAVLNEVIWRNFPTEFWVNFKVFGMFTCTLLFTACQFPLMKRFKA